MANTARNIGSRISMLKRQTVYGARKSCLPFDPFLDLHFEPTRTQPRSCWHRLLVLFRMAFMPALLFTKTLQLSYLHKSSRQPSKTSANGQVKEPKSEAELLVPSVLKAKQYCFVSLDTLDSDVVGWSIVDR